MVSGSETEILLVEDNPADEELTLRALRSVNLANRISVARDGAEALEFLRAPGHNPKVDGLDVLERLRQDTRTRTLPVVVLTSSREEPDILRAYKLGANSYIVKPVEFDSFVKAVSEAGLYWLLLNHPPR